jgi:hypothetical protein
MKERYSFNQLLSRVDRFEKLAIKDKQLSEFDASTVMPGTVIWLKGSNTQHLAAFLEAIERRGLTMYYIGPGDRYVVSEEKKEKDPYETHDFLDPSGNPMEYDVSQDEADEIERGVMNSPCDECGRPMRDYKCSGCNKDQDHCDCDWSDEEKRRDIRPK